MRSARGNALWFITSLVLAFMVWLIATMQVDPVRVEVFNNVPIQFVDNDAMIISNRASLRRTVRVTVRARDSVLQLMTPEDLTVRADISNLPAGTHAVQLQVSTPRRAAVDTQPAQLTVVLEQKQARQKQVVLEIVGEPPAGYTRGEPELSVTQVIVEGTLAQVDRVDSLRATVDLSDQRTRFTDDLSLVPISANGTILNDVEVHQQTVGVTIDIRQREDVLAVPIRPVIDFDSAADGYAVRLDTYSPQTAIIRGSPATLALLPDLLDTATIDLTGRTSSFTISVPTLLPDSLDSGQVTILEGQDVNVRIVVQARLAQIQFDDVPVSVLGEGQGLRVRVIPSRATVLVTGPQAMLDLLTVDDLTVTVDVDGLGVGTYDLEPRAMLDSSNATADEVRVIPSTIGVIIEAIPE
jgi:YbbR domain-containing protein